MKHRESHVLIREPAQSFKGDESIRSDEHESFQPVSYAGKSEFPPIWTNAILDFEVTRLHSDLDSKPAQCENATPANSGFAGWALLR
jgi:hypothetical protein